MSFRLDNCGSVRSVTVADVVSEEDFEENTDSPIKYRKRSEMWHYTPHREHDCDSDDCEEEPCHLNEHDHVNNVQVGAGAVEYCDDERTVEMIADSDSGTHCLSELELQTFEQDCMHPSNPSAESSMEARQLPSVPSMSFSTVPRHRLPCVTPLAENDKYLVFTSSSKTWIPHEISLRRIRDCDTLGRIRRYISKRCGYQNIAGCPSVTVNVG